MTEISPLRRRMIEDMTVRNLSPTTQRSYIHAVSKFSRFFGKSPDWLDLDDVHTFRVHLIATGLAVCSRRTMTDRVALRGIADGIRIEMIEGMGLQISEPMAAIAVGAGRANRFTASAQHRQFVDRL